MKFGEALEAVKEGKLAARAGWNDKGMFIFMRPADELDPQFIINGVKSLPQAYKDTLKGVTFQEGEKVKFRAYLCPKAADNSVVNGWQPNQLDMLTDDWEVI